MSLTKMAFFPDEETRDAAVAKLKGNSEVDVQYIGAARAVENCFPSDTSWPFVIYITDGRENHLIRYGAIQCFYI